MYEEYSSQALPPKEYRALLGAAVCVFSSNNQFFIETILRINDSNYNWYDLTDKTSGRMLESEKEKFVKATGEKGKKIVELFSSIIEERNRIMHAFQVTKNDEQVLATKTKTNEQFYITERFLKDFIKKNNDLSSMLYELRDS